MSREERRTQPLETRLGVLTSFEAQESHLIEAEWVGRRWAHARALEQVRVTDLAVLDLHEAMFGELLEWAGKPRTVDVGPGGRVEVPFLRVREELRKPAEDHAAWLVALGDDPSIAQLGAVLADTHHRFQWIHPFQDTNGRTGRVLDHFVVWSSFKLAASDFQLSPLLVHFPNDDAIEAYYQGLVEADNGRSDRLREYYTGILEVALRPVYTVHWSEGQLSTRCVGIHDSLDAARADALARSTSDPIRVYRVIGPTEEVVLIARAGAELVDDDSPT